MLWQIIGNPTEKETEQITQLWQTSLFNAHYDLQRLACLSNQCLLVYCY
jgi:Chaperone for wingless signalling and trafficking of LDL receptor